MVLESLVWRSPEGIPMPDTTLQTVPSPPPLTSFSEDEILFRDNIRQFAEEKIRPRVREMDEQGVFNKQLIQEFFQLGLMGIEIPEKFGGGGGKNITARAEHSFRPSWRSKNFRASMRQWAYSSTCRTRWSIML